MKLLAVAVLLASSSSYGCVDLAGSYSCYSSLTSKSFDEKVSYKVIKGVNYMSFMDLEFNLNGKVGLFNNVEWIATCSADAVDIKIDDYTFDEDAEPVKDHWLITKSKKGFLVKGTNVDPTDDDGNPVSNPKPVKYTISCQRK